MPTRSTLVTLEGLFTCEGDSHARCPVTTWALIHGNREYTVHYSHFGAIKPGRHCMGTATHTGTAKLLQGGPDALRE